MKKKVIAEGTLKSTLFKEARQKERARNNSEVKEEVEMANKSMKRCSKAYVIRELQIKTMRYNEIQLHTY